MNKQREIKFRAWDKQDKIMYQDIQNGIVFDDASIYGLFNFLNKRGGDYHDWEIMQYTGLKDKNGKEIYEGDVLKSDDRQGAVVFYDGCFRVDGDTWCPMITIFMGEKDAEIIGNIFENPSLIKNGRSV